MSVAWLIFILLFISRSSAWDVNAITFANKNLIGQQSTGIFIDTKNTIYVSDRYNSRIVVWQHGLMMPTRNISGKNLINSWSLFVNKEGDIYADNGEFNIQKHKSIWNDTDSEHVINSKGPCTGLFIDINNTLYYSLVNSHRVDKINLDNDEMRSMTAAGTSCPGPLSNMLDHPHGIFDDKNFDLYMADTYNNRIQRFTTYQFHGITVAGFGAQVNFILNRPTSVVLDADSYLFIVENQNHRIIRSISNGFECLVGCSGESGTSSSQLYNPQTMAFDNIGNIFVTDMNNHRVQKFNLRYRSNEHNPFFTVDKDNFFETANARDWIIGGGNRVSISSQIKISDYLSGGSYYNLSMANSKISMVASGCDPLLGSLMPNIVYNGNYSWRIGDSKSSKIVSVVIRKINNYTYSNIHFAWLAVLQIAFHSEADSAFIIIELRDLVVGDTLFTRRYYSKVNITETYIFFKKYGTYFYMSSWRVETVSIAKNRYGHNFQLSILTTNCSAGGHFGYAYLADLNPSMSLHG
ncbi:hypothetical protein I4U23_011406 [Adineta vaga]|nr:hypothetical protein I4U23_011406 [Adineta vaga]